MRGVNITLEITYFALGIVLAAPVKFLDVFAEALEVGNHELMAKCSRDQHDIWRNDPLKF